MITSAVPCVEPCFKWIPALPTYDEHDLAYSSTVYEQYVQNIMEIEKGLVELRLQYDIAKGKEKKLLKAKIKEAEDSVEAMKIARKSMLKFQSSFETGLVVE